MTSSDYERGAQAAEIKFLKDEVSILRSDVSEIREFVAKLRGAWAFVMLGYGLASTAFGAIIAVISRKVFGG